MCDRLSESFPVVWMRRREKLFQRSCLMFFFVVVLPQEKPFAITHTSKSNWKHMHMCIPSCNQLHVVKMAEAKELKHMSCLAGSHGRPYSSLSSAFFT